MTSFSELIKVLEGVRAGYASNDEESEEGVGSVGMFLAQPFGFMLDAVVTGG